MATLDRFAGINNRLPVDRLKPVERGAPTPVRDAINVDLSTGGTFQTRAGTTRVSTAAARSMFTVDATGALAAVGRELHKFDGTASTKVADLASSFTKLAYAKTPLGVVWSDGFTLGLVKNWISGPLLPLPPNPTPSVSAASGGSLPAGEYGLSFCAVMPDGRRSAMSYPAYVSVAAGGRIDIQAGSQAYPVVVFVTAADGEMFYRAGTLQSGASTSVGHLNADGEGVAYGVTSEMPPGRILGFSKGRLLVADGSMLRYSVAYSFLHRPAYDFIPLDGAIRLVAAVDAGTFIATTDKTWFKQGDIAGEGQFTQVAPYGATEGTLVDLPNSTDLMWFTPRGPVRASQDGAFALLQDKQIQYPAADTGAAVFRETNGMRQYVASLHNPVPSGAAVARSFMDARVID